ncbi:MAG: M20/M25/M40 family metallo-hydrolase [Deltaproteobacteria bacterium]|nr:M20/M25/M40 family metallo-hydrolase [Deltaproteobacteria bacterium]
MLPDTFWTLARRYIAMDTSVQNGNAAVEAFVSEAMATLALKPKITVQRGEHAGKLQVNVLASFGPSGDGGLLLVTHSDTVPPGPLERWTKGPPHTLTRDGDTVIGLGVADVKLDYLCKALALASLDLSALKKPVHLLATHSEEVGLVGAKAFVAADLCRPEWALCGEPSELIPCHAHKGYAVSKVTVRVQTTAAIAATHRIEITGKAAHSSTPHLGVNAIDRLAAWIASDPTLQLTWVRGGSSPNTVPASAQAFVRGASGAHPVESHVSELLHEERGVDLRPAFDALVSLWSDWQALAQAFEPTSDAEFDPARVVCNFGMLASDDGALTATFDARLLPVHDPMELHARFAEKVALVKGAEASIERAAPGMKSATDSPLLQALSACVRELGMPEKAQPRAKATSTEAGVFARKGINAAVFGPGVSVQNAHTPNEWNRVTDLERAVQVYTRLIRKLCA